MPQASLSNYFSTPATNAFRTANVPPSINHDGIKTDNVPDDGIAVSALQRNDENQIPITTKNIANTTTSVKKLVATSLAGPPADIEIEPALVVRVELSHLDSLKRLTMALLPVKYPNTFFSGAVDDPIPADLSRTAVIKGSPVGWIRCRLDADPVPLSSVSTRHGHVQVYIQALCLLPPYRGQGLAAALLRSVCEAALQEQYSASYICAHVWESNAGALEWYEKRGFKKVLMVENYYRKLKPAGAWLVRRELT